VNGRAQMRSGLRSSTALIISALLHAAGILIALLIHLQDPTAADRVIELSIMRESEREEDLSDAEAVSQRGTQSAQSPPMTTVPPPPPAPMLPDIRDEIPDRENRDRPVMEIPSSPLERDMTPEEAWDQLTTLLEEHPEFREMVLREMIAGSGFAPDTVPKINLYLEQMIGGRFDQSWVRSRRGIEHAFRSYDGVHGWRQNSNYGNQVNVLGLLRFLIDLIEGDDE